jgi:hypothetical protein
VEATCIEVPLGKLKVHVAFDGLNFVFPDAAALINDGDILSLRLLPLEVEDLLVLGVAGTICVPPWSKKIGIFMLLEWLEEGAEPAQCVSGAGVVRAVA